MYVTLLLLHVKMMKSSFWGKNVLEFGFGVWNCINNFNSNTVREIIIMILTILRYMKFISTIFQIYRS
ncbi:hypothetical protein AWW71_11545 [Bacillus cereus]|uniref:Uncharacterized protein n=1 Tax=Bacillus thuringiensis serovar mexicanensis TaxID=180868 RepID=A0A242WCA5_BACTU|nr:hypothetical protein B7P25_16350 [Bacillus thuringiensis]KWU63035.1 hypothetical protein AWW71_11545 [Bacillus cereus]OTW49418.1 hypothetical protein BK699_11385 [Bacillus thuringiensis serovar mexicanensis]OTX01875.1 hypothetical protein BK705_18225 [Bacillus thuringiensis serovar monterrey]OTX56175.1 hypothetical protein BK723_08560 [Bacillus thuringiensis serovar pondicheriensis]TNO98433.1 hypothetical protein FH038_03750 [Bacillus sp. CD3-1a]